MQSKPWKTAIGTVAAALLLGASIPASSAEDGEGEGVRIKKIVRCEDGECEETVEELGEGEAGVEVVVDGNGSKRIHVRKIRCENEECEEAMGEVHKMVFVGDGDGDVNVMSGDGADPWVYHAGGHRGSFLGVGLTELTDELRTHFGVSGGAGVMVSKVIEDSPAFRAGIQVGDIISSVDGSDVGSGSALAGAIRKREAGDEVTLGVWRDGSLETLTAAIEERKSMPHSMHNTMEHARKIVIKCDDDEEDCRSRVAISDLGDFDCDGVDECREVRVECQTEDDCVCTINGESADCSSIPGMGE